MSLATYIGTNIELLINDESDDFITIGSYFSDEEHRLNVKNYQLTTPYVYEVNVDGWGIEISKYMNEKTIKESKENLIALFKLMDGYLKSGDFFELYSCWIGDETEQREGELTLNIYNFDIDQIEIPEKTLVRIEK